MTSAPGLRALMIYGLVLPLALMLGYMLATPTDLSSLGTITLILSVVSLPLILKWHYEFMLLSWNMFAVVFFLPGSPELWLLAGGLSFVIALVQRAMSSDVRFMSVPSLVWPLLYTVIVVLITARLTGGIGVRALGSGTFGGRGYIWIIGGTLGFFAMTARKIPVERAYLCTGLFLLGGMASIAVTIAALGPPGLYNVALIFPMTGAEFEKITNAFAFTTGFADSVSRFSGLKAACSAAFWFLLARYGIREMLSGASIWRFFLLVAVALAGALGGFRSVLILQFLTFLLVFYFEGLFRSKYLGIFLGITILGSALLVPMTNKLPLPIQRALSFLPLKVDPIARYEAEASTEWRVQIWQMLLPELPQYFWLGKGLAVSGSELELSGVLAARGQMSSQELAIKGGIYHSGPLTLFIPFGIWGTIGWIWFVTAAIRALYLNYRYGGQSLRKINTFLLAFFVAKIIVFVTVFGDFRSEFPGFVGIIGFSVALNGGIRRRADVAAEEEEALSLQPEAVDALPAPVH